MSWRGPRRREVDANPLPPFNPEATCPKCGGDDVHAYYQAPCSEPDCYTHPVEHQMRHCRRCSYQWAEDVLRP